MKAEEISKKLKYTYSIIEDEYYMYNGKCYELLRDSMLSKMVCNRFACNFGRAKVIIKEMKLSSGIVDILKSNEIINGRDLWKEM